MKNSMKVMSLVLVVLLTIILVPAAKAQADTQYMFVIFETAVTKKGVETSDEFPEERRFYVSNIVGFSTSDQAMIRRASKIADDYFTANVVKPMEGKGIAHEYFDDGIRINDNVIYRLDTRADVEALRTKVLQDLKEQSANIFTFTWAKDQKTNGLATASPVLFYHEPKKPLYGVTEIKT